MEFLPRTTYNKEEKIWHGKKPVRPMSNLDCSVGRVLHSMMRLHQGIALVSDVDNTTVTYAELLRDSVRIAQSLKKMEMKQDDVIGIVAGHTIHTTHIVLGCFFNATPFHPIFPAHEQAVVEHLYAITRPKIIFCEGQYYDKVYKVNRALKLHAKIYTINDHIEGVPQLSELMQPSPMEMFYRPSDLVGDRDQTVCILNSSGTSGLPKAVCISNHSVLLDVNFITPNDVICTFSPLDWVSAIFYLISSAMAGAKRIVTTKPPSPEYLVDLVERHKVTVTLMAPTLAAGVVNIEGVEKRDLSSLRFVSCGGSIMPSQVFLKLRALLKDFQRQMLNSGYGSTEFPQGAAVNFMPTKPNAVGQLLDGVKVKIIDDDGKQLGIGETGEVLLYNGKHWNGYYGNPMETIKMRDVHNWFHTGDLGYFDEDGDLFIVDRKKDIMKYRGVHYSPHEIEAVIQKIPEVVEVCVFGNTNDTEGDRAAAAIVKKAGSPLTEEQVVQHVAESFEVEWKRLHGGVFFMESIPHTGSGKVIRRETKKLALSMA